MYLLCNGTCKFMSALILLTKWVASHGKPSTYFTLSAGICVFKTLASIQADDFSGCGQDWRKGGAKWKIKVCPHLLLLNQSPLMFWTMSEWTPKTAVIIIFRAVTLWEWLTISLITIEITFMELKPAEPTPIATPLIIVSSVALITMSVTLLSEHATQSWIEHFNVSPWWYFEEVILKFALK